MEENKKEKNEKNEEKNKKRRLIILLLLLMATVSALTAVIVLRLGGAKTATVSAPTPTPIAAEASQGAYVAETAAPTRNITMPGWASITIAADTTEITRGVDFFNPDDNEGYYDMTFELFADLGGNGEYVSLYRSGLVYPGNHVQKITLNQPVSAGTYDAYVHIQPYLKGSQSTALNSGNVQLELIVQ